MCCTFPVRSGNVTINSSDVTFVLRGLVERTGVKRSFRPGSAEGRFSQHFLATGLFIKDSQCQSLNEIEP